MDSQSCSARSEVAAACTSCPRAAVSNAWSPASATSRCGRRTARYILFKRTVVIPDLPTFYVVGLDGQPPALSGPTCSVDSARLMPPGILMAGASPSGGRPAKVTVTFLTVPLDAGSATTTQMSARVQQDLASVSAGRFVWAPSRRYIYFEGRAGDTQNVWRVTLDPLTEQWVDGPERLTTGAGEETNVAISPDGTRLVFTARSSRTRLWAFPFDPASGRITGQPYPVTQGSTAEVDFDARPDGLMVAYRTVRAGRNELWVRLDDRRTRAVAVFEHRLADRETAVVSGRREARVLALWDAGPSRSPSRCSIRMAPASGR